MKALLPFKSSEMKYPAFQWVCTAGLIRVYRHLIVHLFGGARWACPVSTIIINSTSQHVMFMVTSPKNVFSLDEEQLPLEFYVSMIYVATRHIHSFAKDVCNSSDKQVLFKRETHLTFTFQLNLQLNFTLGRRVCSSPADI